MEKELISAQVLANTLGLSVETIWRYTREKRIPFLELGNKQYRYKLGDVIGALTGSTAILEKPLEYKPDPNKEYTYQDYLRLPDQQGFHFEVLDGNLIRDPSPTVIHQWILLELAFTLKGYFKQYEPDGKLFVAPLDVTLGTKTVVQPDILYLGGDQKQKLLDERIDGPPYLIVEILSPTSERKDRLQKFHLYQRAGVQHYWLVKADVKSLECYSLKDGLYVRVAYGMDDDILEHPDFPALKVAMADLWTVK